jgi:hypothetical protein
MRDRVGGVCKKHRAPEAPQKASKIDFFFSSSVCVVVHFKNKLNAREKKNSFNWTQWDVLVSDLRATNPMVAL